MKKIGTQLRLRGIETEDTSINHKKKSKQKVKTSWKEAEQKYRQLVDHSLEGLYIVQDFKIVFCNKKLAEIFGFKDYQELLGFNIKDLVEPKSWKLVKSQIDLRLSGKQEISHYEFQGIKKDGSIIDLETLGSTITYNDKPAIQGAIRDITDRKHSEEELRKSEKKFRYLFESSPDAIYILACDGEILDVNLSGCLLHTMGRSELIGKNILDLIHPEFRQSVKEDLPRWFTGEINYYESSVITDDNLKIPVEIRPRRVLFSGKPTFLIYARDISDRVKVGQSFMESQRALSNFMSNLPGMAYRCLNDQNRTMKFVSHGSVSLTGHSPEDLLDNNKISFSEIIHPDHRENVWNDIQKSLIKKQPYRLEYKIITASGEEKWVWEQGRGVFNDKDELIALEGIITDINELKQAEIALRESEKRFRSLIENVPSIAVQGYNTEHKIFFWNKASEIFFGYKKDEAIGKKIEDLIFPDYSRNRMVDAIDQWIKFGKTIPARETSLIHKDGSIFEVHSTHVMLKNIKNEPEMYCLNIDLTELNRTKKDLQKSLYKLKRALDGTIQALTSAVEMRDPYTAGHQQGVAKLACEIAKELGLSDDQIEGLRVASLLHDIGNLNVPAEILNKPGQLTELEYTLLKTHPQFGFEILRTINFPWPVAQIVLQHHERLNGSGYPQGLKDEQIMLEARIIAVADVVEPISSHRPYRPALGIDRALEEIQKGKGLLYDAEVVDVCVKLIKEKGFTFDNH